MNAKELSVKAVHLILLHFASTLRDAGIHEVLPLPFLVVDHVQTGDKIAVELAAGAGLWKSANQKQAIQARTAIYYFFDPACSVACFSCPLSVK